jgi:TRAP-type mannitol/chloroaromatic compound transport system permease small subunit
VQWQSACCTAWKFRVNPALICQGFASANAESLRQYSYQLLEHAMSVLLKFALAVDWINERFSKLAAWAVFISAMICAGNAFIRYGLDSNSDGWFVNFYTLRANGFLELQWYLFAVTVMLGAPYVLKMNEHVRVDLIYSKLKGNGPVYVDLFGLIFFFMPVVIVLLYMCVPYFYQAFLSNESSRNAGGLHIWQVTWTLPVGFALLLAQGLSEIIKRVAYLTGSYEMDTHYEKPLQ